MGRRTAVRFEKIQSRLVKLPALHLPDSKGRFHLNSDTSKFATGSALYQIKNGKHKLIAYESKRLPETARSYSITKLEMCGLAHIIKSKEDLTTARIKRLLETLSSYSFNLYYIKGKDMILSDF